MTRGRRCNVMQVVDAQILPQLNWGPLRSRSMTSFMTQIQFIKPRTSCATSFGGLPSFWTVKLAVSFFSRMASSSTVRFRCHSMESPNSRALIRDKRVFSGALSWTRVNELGPRACSYFFRVSHFSMTRDSTRRSAPADW